MRKQHLPDSEMQLQSSTNDRVQQQHLPFLCHWGGLAACSLPEHCSSLCQCEPLVLWAGLSWQQLSFCIAHKPSPESCENVFVPLCIWIIMWLSGISCDLTCRQKLDTVEFQIAQVWVLWQHVFIILQVVTEVPQDCFVGGVQPELEIFGSEKEFLKSLSKFPPKQHCQTVLCASFLTHYQLVTFPF